MDTPTSLVHQLTPHEHPFLGVEEWLVSHFSFSSVLTHGCGVFTQLLCVGD